jgi:hypothetical protein
MYEAYPGVVTDLGQLSVYDMICLRYRKMDSSGQTLGACIIPKRTPRILCYIDATDEMYVLINNAVNCHTRYSRYIYSELTLLYTFPGCNGGYL